MPKEKSSQCLLIWNFGETLEVVESFEVGREYHESDPFFPEPICSSDDDFPYSFPSVEHSTLFSEPRKESIQIK